MVDKKTRIDFWVISSVLSAKNKIGKEESLMKNLPTDPYSGGPYVMWKGSDFVHVMVPLETTEPLN